MHTSWQRPLRAAATGFSTVALVAGTSIGAGTAVAGADDLIDTKLVIHPTDTASPGLPAGSDAYFLVTADGQPIDDNTATGTIESTVSVPFAAKLGYTPTTSDPLPVAPYYGGPLGIPAPSLYADHMGDVGIFGTWTQTVTYSGDSTYAGAEKTTSFPINPPEGAVITDITLSTSPAGNGQTAITATIEPGAAGVLALTCATTQQIADLTIPDPAYSGGGAGTINATCDTPDAGPYVLLANFISTTPGYSNLLTATQFNTAGPSSNETSGNLPVVTQGQTVHATITGLAPNTAYPGETASTPQSIGTFTSGSDGTLDFDFTVPADLGDGVHHLNILKDGTQVASIEFQVLYLDDGAATTLTGEASSTPGDGGNDDGDGENPNPGAGEGSLAGLFGSLGS